MKRFFKTLILFFLPLSCFVIGLEYWMRHVPNVYSYKNGWLEKNISMVHIWTFGSSHGFYDISPACFSKSAFNSAHSSQTIQFDRFIFEKFIDNADSLEWVILTISYFSLTEDMTKDKLEWWRVKNYCLYYACPYYKGDYRYHCEVIGNPLHIYEQVLRVMKYWTCGVDDVICDSLGLGLNHTKRERREQWVMNGEERVRLHTKNLAENESVIQANKENIEYIINRCKEKNVSVLLLTPPVYRTYYECVDSTQYTLVVDACKEWEQQNAHVHYLNLFKDSRFNEDDFYDADHLETEGAAKLTKILNTYLFPSEKASF